MARPPADEIHGRLDDLVRSILAVASEPMTLEDISAALTRSITPDHPLREWWFDTAWSSTRVKRVKASLDRIGAHRAGVRRGRRRGTPPAVYAIRRR